MVVENNHADVVAATLEVGVGGPRLLLTAVAPGDATLRVLLPGTTETGGAAAHAAAPAATIVVHVRDAACGGMGGGGGGGGAGMIGLGGGGAGSAGSAVGGGGGGGGAGGGSVAAVTPREARLAVGASTTFSMATPADAGSLLQVKKNSLSLSVIRDFSFPCCFFSIRRVSVWGPLGSFTKPSGHSANPIIAPTRATQG